MEVFAWLTNHSRRLAASKAKGLRPLEAVETVRLEAQCRKHTPLTDSAYGCSHGNGTLIIYWDWEEDGQEQGKKEKEIVAKDKRGTVCGGGL